MTAERLLRLYPRTWRERYGDEFLATAGDDRLSWRHALDIVSGAIDAWTLQCDRARDGVTPRDGLVGAAVMSTAAFVLKRAGLPDLAFPVSLTVSMPFWLMKGAPVKAQIAIVAVTVALLVAIH